MDPVSKTNLDLLRTCGLWRVKNETLTLIMNSKMMVNVIINLPAGVRKE